MAGSNFYWCAEIKGFCRMRFSESAVSEDEGSCCCSSGAIVMLSMCIRACAHPAAVSGVLLTCPALVQRSAVQAKMSVPVSATEEAACHPRPLALPMSD